ncbi:MAG: hypothetical protein N2039_01025 [Gemmataceae bacterium]|nr:hypothetical protein [Gemmataceae bacterium]
MSTGRVLPLSPPRRWISDLLSICRDIPLVPFERRMRLAEIAALRSDAGIGWCAIFMKAMSLVSARRPELRRAWLSWPWPRLYQHERSIAMVAVERTWQGEPAVFFGRVESPEMRSLVDIQAHLSRLKTAPLREVREYRRLFRVARWPHPPRRWFWRLAHGSSGPLREKYFGTFGISVTAGLGASALALLSPTTTTLCYSPIEEDGSMCVRFIFDHRVLDGGPVARALVDLEEALTGDLSVELQEIALAAR